VNLAHLHLLLNHVPTVGLGVVLAFYVVALLKRSDDLREMSFAGFYLVALLALPAYFTGNAANFTLQSQADVPRQVLAAHQDAALLALIFMEIAGFIAWLALWRFQRWHESGVLVLAIASFALMARAASIGGYIRHPEILTEASAAPGPVWPQTAAASAALVIDNPWVWPISEVLHFVGLCLLFGIVLLVNLKMLGFIHGAAFAEVKRLLPWAMIGLGINVITGMLFFVTVPDQYTQNPTFVWKIGLMLVAGVTLLYQTMGDQIGGPALRDREPLGGKIVAAASICLWIGVIFLGRFLPFLGSE